MALIDLHARVQDTTGNHKDEWQLDPLELVHDLLYCIMASLMINSSIAVTE